MEWTANFEITVPIVGRLLRAWVDRRLARAFTEKLVAAKSRLERSLAATAQHMLFGGLSPVRFHLRAVAAVGASERPGSMARSGHLLENQRSSNA